MKNASVKNMKKLELMESFNGMSLSAGYIFFLECSKRHQLELAEVKSGRHQLELPTLANLSIKAAKTLNINVNKLERVGFFQGSRSEKIAIANKAIISRFSRKVPLEYCRLFALLSFFFTAL